MICFLGRISSLSHSRRWLELGSRDWERKANAISPALLFPARAGGKFSAKGINHGPAVRMYRLSAQAAAGRWGLGHPKHPQKGHADPITTRGPSRRVGAKSSTSDAIFPSHMLSVSPTTFLFYLPGALAMFLMGRVGYWEPHGHIHSNKWVGLFCLVDFCVWVWFASFFFPKICLQLSERFQALQLYECTCIGMNGHGNETNTPKCEQIQQYSCWYTRANSEIHTSSYMQHIQQHQQLYLGNDDSTYIPLAHMQRYRPALSPLQLSWCKAIGLIIYISLEMYLFSSLYHAAMLGFNCISPTLLWTVLQAGSVWTPVVAEPITKDITAPPQISDPAVRALQEQHRPTQAALGTAQPANLSLHRLSS